MTPERTVSFHRIVALFAVFAVLIGGIGYRLVAFQVLGSTQLQTQGRSFRVNERTILPRRGLILDRGGLVLATNVPSTDIYAQPRKLTDRQKEQLSRELSLILSLPYDKVLERVSATGVEWSRVTRQVDDGTVEIIKRRLAELKLPDLAYQEEPNRIYPNGAFLSPMIGYTNADGVGVYGLEGRYNALIGGEPGVLVAETDAAQQPLAFGQQQYRAPVEGADLVLTIDAAVQRMAEEELARIVAEQGAKGGTILIMDPQTGAILACASNPTYNPNSYTDADPNTFVNPATGEVYEPGSTLKVLTMAAGLQTGAITPNSSFNDEGVFTVATDRVTNHNNAVWGPETMEQVLERSSNVGAAWIASRTGKDKFYAMMRAFGMGQRTGVDLDGEEIGLVKWPDDPTRLWYPIDLATNAFGQGVGVTPMQMVTAVSAIANGGTLYTPYVVSKVERRGEVVLNRAPQPVRQVIRPDVARDVTAMMTQATQSALAGRIALPGYNIAAKTGTAEIPDPRTGRYDPDKTIASIVSFFPAEKPVYTVLIKIDQPRKNAFGSDVAAPGLGRLAGQLLRYAGIPPKSA